MTFVVIYDANVLYPSTLREGPPESVTTRENLPQSPDPRGEVLRSRLQDNELPRADIFSRILRGLQLRHAPRLAEVCQ